MRDADDISLVCLWDSRGALMPLWCVALCRLLAPLLIFSHMIDGISVASRSICSENITRQRDHMLIQRNKPYYLLTVRDSRHRAYIPSPEAQRERKYRSHSRCLSDITLPTSGFNDLEPWSEPNEDTSNGSEPEISFYMNKRISSEPADSQRPVANDLGPSSVWEALFHGFNAPHLGPQKQPDRGTSYDPLLGSNIGDAPLSEELREDKHSTDAAGKDALPFTVESSQDNIENLLSKRLYVKKLFRRIPQIGDTTSILVKSKAHVKGKVGCRSELAMGNTNKIKTTGSLEEPIFDGKPIYAGVYNGLSPLKHVKKRVFREIKVKIDWYAHSITHQIKNIVTFYKQLLRYIHPFQYQMLMTALYDARHTHKVKAMFDDVLGELNSLRNTIISGAKNFNSKIFSIKRCRQAFSMAKALILEIDELYKKSEPLFVLYRQFSSHLRKLPIIDNSKPIVAIVGYVNVGKSSTFQQLTAQHMPEPQKPEISEDTVSQFGLISDVLGLKWRDLGERSVTKVHADIHIADYHFTTRSINVAYVPFRYKNVMEEGQLLDTPGLLWRDMSKTNPYEKLTYAALKDLPCGVIFCFDVSNSTPLEKQIKLYKMLENRFPHRPWINVVSKGDDSSCLIEEGISAVPNEDLVEAVQTMFSDLSAIQEGRTLWQQNDKGKG